MLLQWTAGPILLNSECLQKASELNGFRHAIPYRGAAQVLVPGLGNPTLQLGSPSRAACIYIAGANVSPDALLRIDEVVPLHIANGK